MLSLILTLSLIYIYNKIVTGKVILNVRCTFTVNCHNLTVKWERDNNVLVGNIQLSFFFI